MSKYRGWGALDFEDTIERQTVRVSRTRRRFWIVDAAWDAANTLAGEGGVFSGVKESLEKHYVKDPQKYGRYLARRWRVFPQDLCQRLAELETAQVGTMPFLVVRGLYPTKFWKFRYPGKFVRGYDPEHDPTDDKVLTDRPWFIKGYIYDIISSGLIEQLNAVHRKKEVTDTRVHRNYFSSPFSPIDQFTNDADLPLRFRSAVPEYRFEDDPIVKIGTLTARFALYVCVENPLNDPIWVLDAEHVGGMLSPSDKAMLEADRYMMFDNWRRDLRGRLRAEVQRIKEPNRPGRTPVTRISFDANRIQVDVSETHVENRAVVSRLRDAMQEAGANHAVPVELKRGDVLIVDNYRALIRRAQNTRPPFFMWPRKPTRRWLRLYCAFPAWSGVRKTTSNEASAPSTSESLLQRQGETAGIA